MVSPRGGSHLEEDFTVLAKMSEYNKKSLVNRHWFGQNVRNVKTVTDTSSRFYLEEVSLSLKPLNLPLRDAVLWALNGVF